MAEVRVEPYQFPPSDPSYRGQLGEGYRGPLETRVRGGVVASRGVGGGARKGRLWRQGSG